MADENIVAASIAVKDILDTNIPFDLFPSHIVFQPNVDTIVDLDDRTYQANAQLDYLRDTGGGVITPLGWFHWYAYYDINTPWKNKQSSRYQYPSLGFAQFTMVQSSDWNGDGWVDGQDLGLLLSEFGTTTDGIDLGLILGDWSPPPLPTASLIAVPEPASNMLLILGVISIGVSRYSIRT